MQLLFESGDYSRVAFSDAREAICRETATLDTAKLEESDPFADADDEDE